MMLTARLRSWGPSARVAALLLVAATYAPSLGNRWVWDDHDLLEHNPALESLAGIFLRDVFRADEFHSVPVYRPLVMATHAIGQAAHPGPGIEHVVNLLLHLGIVALVAGIARRLGASEAGSWVGAAVFGVHAGASEPVFWATGRHDLLPAGLMLGGWLALLSNRSWLAGTLLGLTPFCKEPYLLVPATVVIWGLARWPPGVSAPPIDLRALGLSTSGVLAYLGVRTWLGWSIEVQSAASNPLPAVGAGIVRFLHLLIVPGAASVVPPVALSPVAGVSVVLGGVAMVFGLRRRPFLAAVLAPLPVWLPTAVASSAIGIVADRYSYGLFAGIGTLLGVLLSRAGRLAWLLPLALAPITLIRGMDWRDDRTLFTADLQLDPANPRAAFHVAFDLHTRQQDCPAAMPLYRIALDVEPRAATNLQYCLMDDSRWAEAAALGPRTSTAAGAMNTARAYAQLDDTASTVVWAKTATERQPGRVEPWELYGRALAKLGRWEEATTALTHAATLDPGNAALGRLRDTARARSSP